MAEGSGRGLGRYLGKLLSADEHVVHDDDLDALEVYAAGGLAHRLEVTGLDVDDLVSGEDQAAVTLSASAGIHDLGLLGVDGLHDVLLGSSPAWLQKNSPMSMVFA